MSDNKPGGEEEAQIVHEQQVFHLLGGYGREVEYGVALHVGRNIVGVASHPLSTHCL